MPAQPRAIIVQELLWDDDQVIDKLWKKHRVDPWEIEDVVFDDLDAEFWWASDRRHGRRLMVMGRTRAGRKLFVILRPTHRRGLWRARSAWDKR